MNALHPDRPTSPPHTRTHPAMKLTTLLPRLLLLLAAAAAPQSLRAAIPNAFPTQKGNNTFASATPITSPHVVSFATDLTAFTSEESEPALPGLGNTAWWSWTAPSNGWCTVDTLMSTSAPSPLTNTVLGVYSGPALGSLVTVGSNNDVGDYNASAPGLSRVTFYAQKDAIYHIKADAAAGVTIGPNNKEIILRLRHHDLTPSTRDAVFALRNETGLITLQGSLTATSTSSGRLTGKLVTNLRTWSFTGIYSVDGYYHAQFDMPVIKGQPPAPPVSLRIDNIDDGSFLISRGNEVMSSTVVLPYFPRRRLYTNDAPGRGLLTFADQSLGSGYGSGSIQLKPNGAITITGITPDGTPFTQASHQHPLRLGGGNTIYIFGHTTLSKGKGGYTLSLSYRPQPNNAVGGDSYLTRPAPASPTATYYASGLNVTSLISGYAYLPPDDPTKSPMSFLGEKGGDGLFVVDSTPTEFPSGLVSPISYAPPSKFTFTGTITRPKLTLNTKTALVTGSFVDVTGLTRKLRGIVVRHNPSTVRIYGQASGIHRTLYFTVTP